MKTQKIIISVIAYLLTATYVSAKIPETRIYDGDKLTKVKAKSKSEQYAPAIKKLLSDANKELKKNPPSVMEKEMIPPSADKHDYMSMGPYWWPDPSKSNGLPYIRKDGERNPELNKLDRNKLGKMTHNVILFSLAYYFSDDIKYAEKAADYLNTWFLDKNTRMNPNLNYGQTIPGRNNGMGRGTGLIDTYCLIEMLDAVTLIESSGALSKKEKAGLKEWFTQFVDWMQTSSVAMEEKAAKNNHGLAYDVQLTAFALYIGNTELAENTMKAFAVTRLFPQIEPDGKQPLELERTTAFGYTLFNINHMLDMCKLANECDIDIYNAESEDGRSITAAINFMKQYVGKPQSDWPYQQIKGWDKKQDESCWTLRRASFFASENDYLNLSNKYLVTPKNDKRHLLFSLE